MTRLTFPLALTVLAFATAGCQPAKEPEMPADAAEVAAPPAMMPADAPPQEEAAVGTDQLGAGDMTCTDSIGAAEAKKLVDRCIAVSPATHPPCNADNICAVIQDEIDRACGQYGPGETKPAECSA